MFKKFNRKYFIPTVVLFIGVLIVSVAGILNISKADNDTISGDVVNVYNGVNDSQENFNGGAVAYQEGLCSGSEEPFQMCNVNIYDLSVKTGLAITGSSTFSDIAITDSIAVNRTTATSSSLYNIFTATLLQTGDTTPYGNVDGSGFSMLFKGYTADVSSTIGYEATTTIQLNVRHDETSSSTGLASLEIWGNADGAVSEWATFYDKSFSIGSSTPVADLVVSDTGASTTQIILGEQGTSACVQFRVDTNGDGTEEIWYLLFSDDNLSDHSTTTVPSWCN